MIRIGIIGVEGRMGQQLIKEISKGNEMTLGGAVTYAGSPLIGLDVSVLTKDDTTGVIITDNVEKILSNVEVIIDFTTPEATLENLQKIVISPTPVVIGTTGFSQAQIAQLKTYAHQMPILFSPNMSVGVNLVYEIIEKVSKSFGKYADIEILEMHHRYKQDTPSGTALEMGRVIANALGETLEDIAVYDRHDMKRPRKKGEIGFATLRGGNVVGDHAVIFASDDEQLEIVHKARDRALFAQGALYAANWLYNKGAGFYSMRDTFQS